MDVRELISREWLEVDGLGGYAMGTTAGIRTRRYHGLLLTATKPPGGRFMLVNGFDAWVEGVLGRCYISSQVFPPETVHPSGIKHLATFENTPWPRWIHTFEDGTKVATELFVPRGHGAAVLSWELLEKGVANKLHVRFYLSGRDPNTLHKENEGLSFDVEEQDDRLRWQTYPEVPAVVAWTDASYKHEPMWYRNFVYVEERNRGLECEEDLASPGVLSWNLDEGDAHVLLTTLEQDRELLAKGGTVGDTVKILRDLETVRRGGYAHRLDQAADCYVVERGWDKTVLAGYPWFEDHGRDTFVALRGLSLARNRFDEASLVLKNWSQLVSSGMLPSRFPDRGHEAIFDSVDTALWFVIAVADYIAACGEADSPVHREERKHLERACLEIVNGCVAGTRHGIRLDGDGLLAAGEPGVQLTWMNAKVGDYAITPRIGKPIEIQCLWLNAIAFVHSFEPSFDELYHRGLATFRTRFFNPELGYAYDVIDVDHEVGSSDEHLRPNQILAVGGLPLAMFEGDVARKIVDVVEEKLWTPMGLRTLDPDDPEYEPRYEGGVLERDGSYHQGTVWPWLAGAFIEAWLRVRGNTDEAREEAQKRLLAPMQLHLSQAGLGHISEIADGDPPHTARGCPFHAAAVGEWLRIQRLLGAHIDLPATTIVANPEPKKD